MFDRLVRLTDLLAAICLTVMVAAVAYFLSTSPIAYQKSMALRPYPARESDWTSGRDLDVRTFVSIIPYRGSERVDLVRPSDLFQACIVEGRGNCANKSRGLSWYLICEGIPFQRLDLLPIKGFLEGKGHTLIRTRYTLDGVSRVGIIDLLDGGVPTLRGVPMDLADLRQAVPFSSRLLTFTPRVDDQSDYYGSFLENLAFGVVEGAEVTRYLRYVENWHVDLGLPTYERIALAAFAIVIGIFPETHVSPEDYAKMRATAPWTFRIAYTLTWCARGFLVLLPMLVVLHLIRWIRNRRSGGPSNTTSKTHSTTPATTPANGSGPPAPATAG